MPTMMEKSMILFKLDRAKTSLLHRIQVNTFSTNPRELVQVTPWFYCTSAASIAELLPCEWPFLCTALGMTAPCSSFHKSKQCEIASGGETFSSVPLRKLSVQTCDQQLKLHSDDSGLQILILFLIITRIISPHCTDVCVSVLLDSRITFGNLFIVLMSGGPKIL